MEFRKMVMMTLYARQQKRLLDYKEQTFGLYRRKWGWDDLREWHWNMYNIIYETNHQSRLDAWYWMLEAGALGWPRGMGGTGREVGGGFRMGNTCIPVVDSCWCMAKPIQYCKVINLQLKFKKIKRHRDLTKFKASQFHINYSSYYLKSLLWLVFSYKICLPLYI